MVWLLWILVHLRPGAGSIGNTSVVFQFTSASPCTGGAEYNDLHIDISNNYITSTLTIGVTVRRASAHQVPFRPFPFGFPATPELNCNVFVTNGSDECAITEETYFEGDNGWLWHDHLHDQIKFFLRDHEPLPLSATHSSWDVASCVPSRCVNDRFFLSTVTRQSSDGLSASYGFASFVSQSRSTVWGSVLGFTSVLGAPAFGIALLYRLANSDGLCTLRGSCTLDEPPRGL
jgi:hypothetical protein